MEMFDRPSSIETHRRIKPSIRQHQQERIGAGGLAQPFKRAREAPCPDPRRQHERRIA